MPFALESFFIILGRVSGLFISAPILNSRQLPLRIRSLIIVLLSATFAYFIPVQYDIELTSPGHFIAAMAVEIFIGYTIGFVAFIVFATVQLAGQIIDMQMGFAMVNVVDPQTGTQIPLMGNFQYLIALLLYLSVNGHHYLLQAVIQSYQYIPVLGLSLSPSFFALMVEMTVFMFVAALKIAIPMVTAILISDIAMGFIAKTVPQMNVFIVGLSLKILMGFIILLLVLPVYIWFTGILFVSFFEYLDLILKIMGT